MEDVIEQTIRNEKEKIESIEFIKINYVNKEERNRYKYLVSEIDSINRRMNEIIKGLDMQEPPF